MRSVGNTTLSLGLLNAPVKLYPATTSQDFAFKMCGPEGEPVEQVYRITGTDEIVGTSADCGRSYEGRPIDRAQIETINGESLKEEVDGVVVDLKETMGIQRFIPVKSIPFERVTGWYYVGPGKGSDQALATIIKAMEKKKLAAVTKYCLRGRQGCFVLFVRDGVLNAVRMTFAPDINEVTNEIRVESEPVKAHVDAAITLIEEYSDEDAAVLDTMEDTLVAKKRALTEAILADEDYEPVEVNARPAVDLMDAISAEIDRVKEEKVAA